MPGHLWFSREVFLEGKEFFEDEQSERNGFERWAKEDETSGSQSDDAPGAPIQTRAQRPRGRSCSPDILRFEKSMSSFSAQDAPDTHEPDPDPLTRFYRSDERQPASLNRDGFLNGRLIKTTTCSQTKRQTETRLCPTAELDVKSLDIWQCVCVVSAGSRKQHLYNTESGFMRLSGMVTSHLVSLTTMRSKRLKRSILCTNATSTDIKHNLTWFQTLTTSTRKNNDLNYWETGCQYRCPVPKWFVQKNKSFRWRSWITEKIRSFHGSVEHGSELVRMNPIRWFVPSERHKSHSGTPPQKNWP